MSVIQATCQELIHILDTQKLQTLEEIRQYPVPIPACDAQFNYLLEKRDYLTVERNRLNQLVQADNTLTVHDLLHFIAASSFINGDLEQKLRTPLEALQ